MRVAKSPRVNEAEKKQGVCEQESSYLHLQNVDSEQCCHPVSPASPRTGHSEFCVPALQGWVQKPVTDSGSPGWEG